MSWGNPLTRKQYIFVTVSAITALALAWGLPSLRETYGPVIIKQRIRHQHKEALAKGEPVDHIVLPTEASLGHVLWINLTRPVDMLFRSFIIAALCVYIAVIFGGYLSGWQYQRAWLTLGAGIFYLCLATFPFVFESVYHWRTSIVGLAYLGLGGGFMVSALFGSAIMNKVRSTTVSIFLILTCLRCT
jgi:hypothetical protein